MTSRPPCASTATGLAGPRRASSARNSKTARWRSSSSHGLRLALWPRTSLSKDSGLPQDAAAATDVCLAHNVTSRAEVDAVMAEALKAGASLVKSAQDTFYGGYAGYFMDPDQHLWEVAWNPQMLPQNQASGEHMNKPKHPVAIVAAEAAPRTKPSNYPEPFFSRMSGRQKRALGDVFGLSNFGVNLTRLAPGSRSALRHAHTKQDEFVYILEGKPTLHTDEGRTPLEPGMCAGFKAGTGNGHCLINETDEDVVYLEVGDRTAGDEGSYPDDDLRALLVEGQWSFVHKDGKPY